MYQVIKEKEQEEALKNSQQGNQGAGYSSNIANPNPDSNSQPLIQENNQPADFGDLPTENEVVQNEGIQGQGYQSNVIDPNAPISSDLPPQPAANELPVIQNPPVISGPIPQDNPHVVPLPNQPPFSNVQGEASYSSATGYKPGANINYAPQPTGARPAIYDLPNQKAQPQPGVYPQPQPYNPPGAYPVQNNAYPVQNYPNQYPPQGQVVYQQQPGGAYVPPGKQQGNYSSYNVAGQQSQPIIIKETVVQPVVVKEEKQSNANTDNCGDVLCCLFCCCLYCCIAGNN